MFYVLRRERGILDRHCSRAVPLSRSSALNLRVALSHEGRGRINECSNPSYLLFGDVGEATGGRSASPRTFF